MGEHSVVVDAPIDVAYHRWTQFETWPDFMDAVDTVIELGPDRLYWHVTIAGVSREFDTTITELVPNQRIAWRTNTGPDHSGAVTFHAVDHATTRVSLQMDFDPHGLLEHVGDKLGFVTARVESDMANFKRVVEQHAGPATDTRLDDRGA